MERTGLLHSYTRKLNEDWEWYNQRETSTEGQAFHKSLEKTLNFLKEVKKTQDPYLILRVEQATLEHSLTYSVNSAEMKSSLPLFFNKLLFAIPCFLPFLF